MHLPRVVSWFGTLLFEIKSVVAIAMVAISGGACDRLFTAYLVFSRALGPRWLSVMSRAAAAVAETVVMVGTWCGCLVLKATGSLVIYK
jgi:hypothetical protein